ncbi:dihydropteroate synthase [Halorhodospira halochloris]|uniref:Dihydropteroate synthase n=1 Tax=Halorhodospira halochloris TaxID=1052 RepID=A0A0X8X912_HALHR|nr:dihydropteroate synthase [Halorhodospira halochloris]BAU57757.1 dihydropteroate synthase [Halorhodospira halochloris]
MVAQLQPAPLDFGRCRLTFEQPRIMGVINVTPDSFSDGGLFVDVDSALAQAEKLISEGADLLDVGGESSRPGAEQVPLELEIERVVPVVEALRKRFDVPISVDTCKPQVASAAVAAGADMVNDIRALGADGALENASFWEVPICLMHMQGEPRTMQHSPSYVDVVSEVVDYLAARVGAAEQAGVPRQRLVVDPGFGFGKTLEHNLELLRRLGEVAALGLPVLVGMSRKSMIGKVLGDKPVDQRLAGGLAAASLAVWHGADIVRTHDVAATHDAVRFTAAVRDSS